MCDSKFINGLDSNKVLDDFFNDPLERIKLIDSLTKPLRPKERPVPEESTCTECGSKDLKATIIPAAGPFSGHITCNSCGFRESVTSHLTKKIFSVESIK
jgi:hypothetical protein